ncbi:uncharacterized protein LOC116199715 [Punica granatum]|uniref:Uncharacterized protein LOC116199715 n=1 Tax=Punica granatum TaxID=22663 RepID=A0A218W269_PUNGR|nr:uncharacterized protein LOC116199715 [Punica granatum]OWM66212.1 hypothetical protein CDL15_Pgr013429 [Punica granatum]
MEWQPQPQPELVGVAPMTTVLLHCADLLGAYDLAGCRMHALTVHHSDPRHPGPVQALAIVDVLLASEKRLRHGHRDWYSILQVRATSRPEVVRAQFARLVHLLDPTKNKFPFAEYAVGLVVNAYRVLSDPAAKAKYDAEVAPPATFNTVCPYCYYIFVYKITYKDRCLRCQSCRRAFHAVAVDGPLPEIITIVGADGRVEEGYCCRLAGFHLQYQLNPDVLEAEKSGDAPFVKVPSMEEEVVRRQGGLGGSNGAGGAVRVEVPKDEQRPRKMRVKTTAKTTKKMMGRGVGNPILAPQPQTNNDADGIVSEVKDGDGDGFEDDFKFTFEGDDIFVECFSGSQMVL